MARSSSIRRLTSISKFDMSLTSVIRRNRSVTLNGRRGKLRFVHGCLGGEVVGGWIDSACRQFRLAGRFCVKLGSVVLRQATVACLSAPKAEHTAKDGGFSGRCRPRPELNTGILGARSFKLCQIAGRVLSYLANVVMLTLGAWFREGIDRPGIPKEGA